MSLSLVYDMTKVLQDEVRALPRKSDPRYRRRMTPEDSDLLVDFKPIGASDFLAEVWACLELIRVSGQT